MLIGYRSSNHPQQVLRRGADENIDDRATEPNFFADLDRRFHFTIDVAASSDNTKCVRFYAEPPRHLLDERLADGALGIDGLAQSWAGETVWCNPPYSSIGPWVAKAWREHPAAKTVMLLPANRTEQNWWQDQVEPFRDRADSPLRVEFLKGRIRFLSPGRTVIGPNERPPFGCCLLIWQ